MANVQYTIGSGDRTDNSAFTVPGDEDGGAGDDSFEVDQSDAGDRMVWLVHVENSWDTDVDVTVRGSHYNDSSMANATDDGNTQTISSSSSDACSGTTPHSFLEINVNPASNPGSGNLVVTFQSREA